MTATDTYTTRPVAAARMSSSPPSHLTTTRTRSSSQSNRHPYPLSPGSSSSHSALHAALHSPSKSPAGSSSSSLHIRTASRSLSNIAINKVATTNPGLLFNSAIAGKDGNIIMGTTSGSNMKRSGRARSSSLVTVTEVGGDEPEEVVDRMGVGVNENANWVNAPGSWLIHPVMILFAKVMIDALPSITQDLSWTIVNLGYAAVSFTMFHFVTGVPFESNLSSSGAWDDLTLWEQIDSGAQYTPAKKWLTSVPILLFLISTHYTKYEPVLFAINFLATLFVLFPKLPILHRLRFHFLPNQQAETSSAPTPTASRAPSPRLTAILESEHLHH